MMETKLDAIYYALMLLVKVEAMRGANEVRMSRGLVAANSEDAFFYVESKADTAIETRDGAAPAKEG